MRLGAPETEKRSGEQTKRDLMALQWTYLSTVQAISKEMLSEDAQKWTTLSGGKVRIFKRALPDALSLIAETPILFFRPRIDLTNLFLRFDSFPDDKLPDGVLRRCEHEKMPVGMSNLHRLYLLTIHSAAREMDAGFMEIFTGLTRHEISVVKKVPIKQLIQVVEEFVFLYKHRVELAYLITTADQKLRDGLESASYSPTIKRTIDEVAAAIMTSDIPVEQLIYVNRY